MAIQNFVAEDLGTEKGAKIVPLKPALSTPELKWLNSKALGIHAPDSTPQRPRIATVSSTMKVKIKRVNAVAIWKWNVPNDDVCGICRVPFDGCCPDCQIPGDDCPILTGQCKHVFHMYALWLLLLDGRHCIEKWLNTDTKEQCPMDRQPWGSPLLGSFVDLVTSKSK